MCAHNNRSTSHFNSSTIAVVTLSSTTLSTSNNDYQTISTCMQCLALYSTHTRHPKLKNRSNVAQRKLSFVEPVNVVCEHIVEDVFHMIPVRLAACGVIRKGLVVRSHGNSFKCRFEVFLVLEKLFFSLKKG